MTKCEIKKIDGERLFICCGKAMTRGSGFFATDYMCSECGSEYSMSGSKLAPRSQWGEETGESFY